MKINSLEMEWTDTGCVAKASGFDGVMLTCPRCQELLPRDKTHRCGDKVRRKKSCSDCGDGPCDMNCGPVIEAPKKKA